MALRDSEQFVYDYIERQGGMFEIDDSVALIIDYRNTPKYASKDQMIADWDIDHKNLYDLVISVFTACLINDFLTYQAIVGMLNHKIKLPDELDRIKIVADLIGLIAQTGLIEIASEQGEYHQVFTEYSLHEPIPMEDKHVTITLRPQPVEENWTPEFGSILLGHKMYHHDGFVRLSHLERMGQIPFKINKAFVEQYEEAPKNEPDTEEKQAQWEIFQKESLDKYTELMEADQRFFIRHGYDYRLRTYSGSYHLNPQGSSFKKAAIVLANAEIVEGF